MSAFLTNVRFVCTHADSHAHTHTKRGERRGERERREERREREREREEKEREMHTLATMQMHNTTVQFDKQNHRLNQNEGIRSVSVRR